MRRCAVCLLAAKVCIAAAGAAQVVRIAGGAGNLNAGQGVSVGVFQPDSTSTLAIGAAQGFRLSARREVALGDTSMAVGDSTLDLSLPTDIENAPRAFQARGVLLKRGSEGNFAFVGLTGANYANAYVNAVTPSRFVSVLAGKMPLASGTLSMLHTAGLRSNALLSWSVSRRQAWHFAATAGRSEGKGILRLSTHGETAASRLDVSLGLGNLQLQPTTAGQPFTLERTGLNAAASHRFGQALTVSAARHVYATANAASDPAYSGVTAPRSQLLEAGAALSLGALNVQGRVLAAGSGEQHSTGTVFLAGWTARAWSTQAAFFRSQSTTPAHGDGNGSSHVDFSSMQLSAAQQVHPRLRLEQSLNLGGNSNGFSFGGAWDGNRLAVSVTERATYVPFGNVAGFHRVLVLGMRLRWGNAETNAAVSHGGGLPPTVLVSTESYFGALDAQPGRLAATTRLPRYAVSGVVVDDAAQPVRGAALQIGDQLVFTNSEGHFLLRLARNRPVSLRVLPEQFLTAQQYRASESTVLVQPTADDTAQLHLRVQACNACAAVSAPTPSLAAVSAQTVAGRSSPWMRALQTAGALARRMVHWRGNAPATL